MKFCKSNQVTIGKQWFRQALYCSCGAQPEWFCQNLPYWYCDTGKYSLEPPLKHFWFVILSFCSCPNFLVYSSLQSKLYGQNCVMIIRASVKVNRSNEFQVVDMARSTVPIFENCKLSNFWGYLTENVDLWDPIKHNQPKVWAIFSVVFAYMDLWSSHQQIMILCTKCFNVLNSELIIIFFI